MPPAASEACRACACAHERTHTQVFAMTAPLITTSDGKKMGKSEGGAIWLNEDMLSPFDYWQVHPRTHAVRAHTHIDTQACRCTTTEMMLLWSLEQF